MTDSLLNHVPEELLDDWKQRWPDAESRGELVREIARWANAQRFAEGKELHYAVVNHLGGPPPPKPRKPAPLPIPELEGRVTETFPAPIALAFNSMLEADSATAKYAGFCDVVESLVHYLAMVYCAAFLDGVRRTPRSDEAFLAVFAQPNWSIGHYIRLIDNLSDGMGDCAGRFPFSAHLDELKSPTLRGLMAALVNARNRDWGHAAGRDQRHFERAYPEVRETLNELLRQVLWLGDVDLLHPIAESEGQVTRAQRLMGLTPTDIEIDPIPLPEPLQKDGSPTNTVLVRWDSQTLWLAPFALFGAGDGGKGVFLLQRHVGDLRVRRLIYVSYDSSHSDLDVKAPHPLVEHINRLVAPLELSARIRSDESSLKQLTRMQSMTIQGLTHYRRVLIEGTAGSGKTMLAIARAMQAADAGQKVLFLCYNKTLAMYLKWQHTHKNLTIRHFHGLCRDLCVEAGIPFQPPGTKEWWDRTAPELLTEAVDELDPRFDLIVVDEGQDFESGWWGSIEDLLVEPGGPLCIFLDRHQKLYGRVLAFPATERPYQLSINCRNTRNIADACGNVLGVEIPVWETAPLGAPITLRRYADEEECADIYAEELKRLLEANQLEPRQIAVLGLRNLRFSPIRHADITQEWITQDLALWGERVFFSTTKGFKGLEADVVILLDLDGFTEIFQKPDLYVACSRAKHKLIVLTSSEEIAAYVSEYAGS